MYLKRNPIALDNGSNYGYYFIIKDLAEELKKQFTCFAEKIEKYIYFRVPMEKEVNKKW